MLSSLRRAVFSVASRSSRGYRLSVLIFHRVLPTHDSLLPYDPDEATFERTMQWVRSTFNVLPLDRAIDDLKAARLPPRALAITFDDGYANNATVAAPILSRLGLPATFFIATGYLDGGRMFNDVVIEAVRGCPRSELDLQNLGLGCYATGSLTERRCAIDALLEALKYIGERERAELANRIAATAGVSLPQNLMMTSEQVANLARSGFLLGAHTVSHPILAKTDAETARREIDQGRRRVEDLCGARVNLFAYPNGRPNIDYVSATTRLVRDLGFHGAVSTSRGVADVGSDPFQIPRFTPWDSRPLPFAAQLFANMSKVSPIYASV